MPVELTPAEDTEMDGIALLALVLLVMGVALIILLRSWLDRPSWLSGYHARPGTEPKTTLAHTEEQGLANREDDGGGWSWDDHEDRPA